MTRLRQQLEDARQRLLFLPAVFIAVGLLAALGISWLDRRVPSEALPEIFQTSVDGGRDVLSTIATGLITAYTLLLTLLLIAVQLASSQFSPRTLRHWLGDRTLQRAIGLVVATVVFCLLALYQTRDLDDVDTFDPNLSVLTAIIFAVTSLIVVLRSVDHIADSMRVGSVAKTVMRETLDLIERIAEDQPLDRPMISPAPQLLPSTPDRAPEDVHVVLSESAGWVQEIDLEKIFDACDEGTTVRLPLAVGAFSLSGIPIAWLSPVPEAPEDREEFDRRVRSAVSIGDVRTMRQDVGFGITRLVDIVLRALSPSLNDPNTAKDVIAHLGQVLLALLSQPERGRVSTRDGRTVVATEHSHQKYVLAAFDQVRHSAISSPQVLAVLVQTLLTIRDEVRRRPLPTRIDVLDDLLDEIAADVVRSDLSPHEKARILGLLPDELRPAAG